MTDLYGSFFQFNGQSSEPYHLVFANIETKRNRQLYGTIKSETIFNKTNKTKYLIGDNYDDYPFSFEIEIVTEDGRTIDEASRREIEKWLFNLNSYKKLYMYNCNENTGVTTLGNIYLNCRFINPERIEYNGGVVGYYATLESDSGSWWEDVECTYENNNGSTEQSNSHSFCVEVDSCPVDFIYPDIEVEMKSTIGGSARDMNFLQIRNNSDTVLSSGSASLSYRTLYLADIVDNGSTIKIDNETKQITKNNTLISPDALTSLDFPRLKNGANNFIIKGGDATIKFNYKTRRTII